MYEIIQSFLLVAAAEMGDKTQLLAFVLATRFRKPGPVLAGIFVATIANHALAAGLGSWAAGLVSPVVLRWGLALTFFAFGLWLLVPDKEGEGPPASSALGAFGASTVAFFLAEMGDKTQLATIALGAKFDSLMLVTIGTTIGMMVSSTLAVIFGERLATVIPMQWMRRGSAVLFAIFGAAIAAGL